MPHVLSTSTPERRPCARLAPRLHAARPEKVKSLPENLIFRNRSGRSARSAVPSASRSHSARRTEDQRTSACETTCSWFVQSIPAHRLIREDALPFCRARTALQHIFQSIISQTAVLIELKQTVADCARKVYQPKPYRVISSVVERFVHIEDAGSSNLSSPTIFAPRRAN